MIISAIIEQKKLNLPTRYHKDRHTKTNVRDIFFTKIITLHERENAAL